MIREEQLELISVYVILRTIPITDTMTIGDIIHPSYLDSDFIEYKYDEDEIVIYRKQMETPTEHLERLKNLKAREKIAIERQFNYYQSNYQNKTLDEVLGEDLKDINKKIDNLNNG